jgi:hypothetical protein
MAVRVICLTLPTSDLVNTNDGELAVTVAPFSTVSTKLKGSTLSVEFSVMLL